MATDPYASYAAAAADPAQRVFNIVPSDAIDLPFVTTAIYVGVTGDVAVLDRLSGDKVTFVAFPAGQYLPIRVARVLANGTTAGSLVGMA